MASGAVATLLLQRTGKPLVPEPRSSAHSIISSPGRTVRSDATDVFPATAAPFNVTTTRSPLAASTSRDASVSLCSGDHLYTEDAMVAWCKHGYHTRNRHDLFAPGDVKPGATICANNWVQFFRNFAQNISVPYTLITLESDVAIPFGVLPGVREQRLSADFFQGGGERRIQMPLLWYGTNLGVAAHSLVHGTPLGLNRARHGAAMRSALRWRRVRRNSELVDSTVHLRSAHERIATVHRRSRQGVTNPMQAACC